jgi:AAA+ superfamily predicted ATPase
MPQPRLEITFGPSPSVYYARAVRLAQGLPGYRVHGEGPEIFHRVTLARPLADETTWEQLRHLIRLIAAWRSASVRVAGQPTGFWSLLRRLKQIQACSTQKQAQAEGDGYCLGQHTPSDEAVHFGCRFIKGVSRRLHPLIQRERSWIAYGRLTPGRDAFRVDRQAIFTVLEQHSRTEACVFCPAFSWKRVRASVLALPQVIDLGSNSPFEVRYAESNPNQAIGIQGKRAGEAFPISLGFGPDNPAGPGEPPVRQVPQVYYTDIAGQDAALAQVHNVVDLPLRYAAYFEALGVEPHRGILLYGPPGNGKTLLAKAVATECHAHFELINGPEILSRWVGHSEALLRQVFGRAQQLAPSLVLLDELDSLAPRRALLSQQHDIQLVAQLLVLLDGLEARGRVAVVATTNRPEAIDPALLRPGRFDYHIAVPCPDPAGRVAVFQRALAKLKTARGLKLEALAAQTEGYSAAELVAVCREAGMYAIRRGIAQGRAARRVVVTRQDLRDALAAWRTKRVVEPP